MSVQAIIDHLSLVQKEAPYLAKVDSSAAYEKALELVEQLFDRDPVKFEPWINFLSYQIEKYEDSDEIFSEFNKEIESLDSGIALLKTLMDQQCLQAKDLEEELGSKSNVSMILNGSRSLTKKHIDELSKRFGISPSNFF